MSDLENLVFSCIDRYMHGGTSGIGNVRTHQRYANVTSYDPEKHLGKVMLMPEGQESGWLPIGTGAIGNSYGIAMGLQPGDGKKTGDQVIVDFSEGDIESGKIIQRVHSDSDKPPKVESGEFVLWSKFKQSKGQSGLGNDATGGGSTPNDEAQGGQGGSGQQIYFKKDGSLTISDGNGSTITHDGNGNWKLSCKKFEVQASDTVLINGSSSVTITASSGLNLNGSPVKVNGGGSGIPPFTVG